MQGRRRAAGTILALLASAGLAGPLAAQTLARRIELTPIRGTSRMFQPTTLIANLDAGDLVAGRTWWQVQGGVYVETFVGFLWSPEAGSTVFTIPLSLYFNDNTHIPAEIADDGTVVGTDVFTRTVQTLPFRWTEAGGFEFLTVPGAGWSGSTAAVSRDGSIAAGEVHEGLAGPSRASRWVNAELDVFGPAGMWSAVFDVSDDGAVQIGEIGSSFADVRATRWIQGVEQGLDPAPGETSSTARFSSDDGAVAIGQATVGGRDVLVRWEADGSATAFTPPGSYGVEVLNAIDPAGQAAVGALSVNGDWDPFLWRLVDGFTVIAELGRNDYDRSQAFDLSDNGRRVVGQLQASVVFNGEPPTTGFLWTRRGTQSLDDMLSAAGEPPQGIFHAGAISGDGRRILATGVVRPRINDTSAILIELVSRRPRVIERVVPATASQCR